MNVCTSRFLYRFIISVLSIFSLMVILPVFVHASSENVKKEVKEAATAIGDYTIEQKDIAVAKARALMDKIDDKTNVLEERVEKDWGSLKQSSRENYRKSLKELRKRRNDLSEWYGSMKQSSKDTWNEAKKGFMQSYKNVVNEYDAAEKKIDKAK